MKKVLLCCLTEDKEGAEVKYDLDLRRKIINMPPIAFIITLTTHKTRSE